MKAIAYYRVSTVAQGRSGLGLEAQQSAVQSLVAHRGFELLATFKEVESGKRNDRPQLRAALHYAKLTGATLIIAKLDRLSRNAAFLLTLRESGVRFMAADLPDANDLTIGLLAVVAEAERNAISRRTREALAQVNRRIEIAGEHVSRTGRQISRLGNPRGWRGRSGENSRAVKAVQAAAQGRADDLRPVLEQLAQEGVTGLSQIAKELNRRGIKTPRQGAWHASTVRSLLQRLAG